MIKLYLYIYIYITYIYTDVYNVYYIYNYISIYAKPLWVMKRMGGLHCLHDFTIYMYYAPCFLLVEHSLCHELISVLINVHIYVCT